MEGGKMSACRPVNIPQPVGATDPEVAARLDCINHLTTLLLTLQAQVSPHQTADGSDGGHLAGASSPSGQQFALSEDWQLRGFLPLEQSHRQLVFEKQDDQVCTYVMQTVHLLRCPATRARPINLRYCDVKTLPGGLIEHSSHPASCGLIESCLSV